MRRPTFVFRLNSLFDSWFTNPRIPSDGNPGHFAPFGNVGTPYMATLSLLGLTVGLPVWLFSTSLVPAISTSSQLIPPPEQHHVDSKVDVTGISVYLELLYPSKVW